MKNLQNLFLEKSYELAKQHAHIIEVECKNMCIKYSCKPEDLLIEYHTDTTIKINTKGIHLKIDNKFTIDGNNVEGF
jgi:hypothetical protein